MSSTPSTGIVVGDAFAFFGFLLLCVFELFVNTSLTDLESDLVAAKDLCDQLNPLFLPVSIAHFMFTLLLLLCGKWVQVLVQIPLIVYHFRLFQRQKMYLDFMSIRRADELKIQFKKHYVELGCYLLEFLWAFVTFVSSLLFQLMYIFSFDSFIIDLVHRLSK